MTKTSWLAGCRMLLVLSLGSGSLLCWGQGICCGQGIDPGGDPSGERNLATSGLLPEGSGLAASIREGASIDQHPDVIFAEDFEADDYLSHWDDVRNDRGEVLSIVEVDAASGVEADSAGSEANRSRAGGRCGSPPRSGETPAVA